MIKIYRPNDAEKLFNEYVSSKSNCSLCREALYEVGKKTGYGVVISKIGNSKNGWFAALSPKTGGDPEFDFTIQLMPFSHLTHFSQIASYPGLGENFGASFSKICRAMTTTMMQDKNLKSISEEKELSVSVATYGKCTTWKEKKEHLHIKIFPFRGNIGQPYTVDSSFEKKEIFEKNTGKEFVKMDPVKKVMLKEKRFNQLAGDLIGLLKQQ